MFDWYLVNGLVQGIFLAATIFVNGVVDWRMVVATDGEWIQAPISGDFMLPVAASLTISIKGVVL